MVLAKAQGPAEGAGWFQVGFTTIQPCSLQHWDLPVWHKPPFPTSKAPSRHPASVPSLLGEASSLCALHLPPSPPDTVGVLLETPQHSACHTAIAVASLWPACGWVLLSSLRLDWLLLPSDSHPSLLLQAVAVCQGSYGGAPHPVSG